MPLSRTGIVAGQEKDPQIIARKSVLSGIMEQERSLMKTVGVEDKAAAG